MIKLKLVVLFPIGAFYPAQTGGPNNTIYWICEQLVQEGIEPVIVTTNQGLPAGIQLDSWLNESFGKIKYIKTRFHYLPIGAFIELIKVMKQVDVIHLTALFYPQSIFAATLGLMYGKKIIWSPRGELEAAALNYSRVRKRIFLFLIKIFYKKKVCFHATSQPEQQRIYEVFGKKVRTFILPNFLKLEPPVVTEKKKQLLFVGRIHPIKNIDLLLESCALSKEFRKQEIKLFIAGDGERLYITSLKQLAKELGIQAQVNFVGHLEGYPKKQLFAESHFSFLLSKSENFGNVVIESMSNSTPVIASKGTPWKLLEEKKAGFWVNANKEEIALLIDRILTMSEAEYKAYCSNALVLTKTMFDIQQNGHKWIEIYNATK